MTQNFPTAARPPAGVGLIGAGGRGVLNLAAKIGQRQEALGLRVVAVCDTNAQRREDAKAYLENQLQLLGRPRPIRTYAGAREMIADPEVKAVLITTPQDAHEEPFLAAAEAGKVIFCDKPLAATPEACLRMRGAYEQSGRPCMIGFTRRYEHSWMQMHRMIQEGAVGQPRLLLLRSVIPYYTYFHRWHRRKAWSGGILNEKSAHHFDALNWFAGSTPLRIHALGGRTGAFAPRPGYPARCGECDRDCPWRAINEHRGQDAVGRLRSDYADDPELRLINDKCVYDPQSDIDDHGIVTIQYANGVQAVLFLCIFGPHSPDQETLEVVGDGGRMILTRHPGTIDLATVGHEGNIQKQIDARDPLHQTSHFGADHRLIEMMANFVHDGTPPPVGFPEAFQASMMAFAAQDSIAAQGRVVEYKE